MAPTTSCSDINTLGVVLFLLKEGETPPLEWLARMLLLGLIEVALRAPGGFVASARGERYLR